jgi:hypothetical protein
MATSFLVVHERASNGKGKRRSPSGMTNQKDECGAMFGWAVEQTQIAFGDDKSKR